MVLRRGRRIACALALCAVRASAQSPPPQTADDALHAMSQLADVVFAGQVTGVRRHAGAGGATGVVEIDFAVQDAVRGVSGSSYALREWAGLWPVGYEPFRVGQRFLMLLHAPGAAGLSSPVGGMDGAIPIRGGDQAALPQTARSAAPRLAGTTMAATPAAADSSVVDLRWVQTRIVRPLSYRVESLALPTARQTVVRAFTAEAGLADVAEPAPASTSQAAIEEASVPAGEAALDPSSQVETYTTVVGMLRDWAKDDHGPL